MKSIRFAVLLLSAVAGISAFPLNLSAADDPFDPTRHFKIEDPAELKPDDARNIYNGIVGEMAGGYAQSGDPAAKKYRKWRRFNSSPYLSQGHGNRYLNNYGNELASGYLAMQPGEKMPVGSVLVKDSFTVTGSKETFAGAFFVMEKLASGVSSKNGDWRYVMIMPDGSVFGDTVGADADKMDFCHSCHKWAKDRDFLYLIPDKYRR